MNQQKHTIQSSQNCVLSEQALASIQEHQKALDRYSVEYFTVVDRDSNYYSPLFATKAQSDAILDSIRVTCPSAYGEEHKVYFTSEHEAGRQDVSELKFAIDLFEGERVKEMFRRREEELSQQPARML